MKLGKFTLIILSMIVIFVSCNNDDDVSPIVIRDVAEVYAEDIVTIEEYLNTHFYNYEAFDFGNPNSLANDSFEIVFDTIAGVNADKIPLIDQVDFKMVPNITDNSIEYKLYYLKVREGNGETLYPSDEAFLNYQGSGLENGNVFDSTATPILLNLTAVGLSISGVIDGFREGLVEFKTADSKTDNGDGTFAYHNHGIGAIFIPSVLGYFSQSLTGVTSYSPLTFKVSLMGNVHTDFDRDGIFSYMEDLHNDNDVYTDDTDEDLIPNFLDNDDDGDGVLTKDEIESISYPEEGMADFMSEAEAQSYYDTNAAVDEIFMNIVYNNSDATYTLNTLILTDSNGNGTPDYLDATYPE